MNHVYEQCTLAFVFMSHNQFKPDTLDKTVRTVYLQ